MSRTALAVVLAAAALAAPLAADAKGPDRASVCGADRCVSIRGSSVTGILDWSGRPGFDQLPAPHRVPFYRLTLYDRGRPAWLVLYAPSVARIRVTQLGVYPYGSIGPYWRSVTPGGASALARAKHGLRPFPTPASWR